jgi:uncharacterized membrane protein YfcA
MPPVRRTFQLAVVGTAAGAFAGVFGVGGGIVIVPLLIVWLGYEEREATGTSLAAIVVISSFTAGLQALYGNVDWARGALIGIPAMAGAVIGTWLQQRVPVHWISLGFAALLVAIAISLVV